MGRRGRGSTPHTPQCGDTPLRGASATVCEGQAASCGPCARPTIPAVGCEGASHAYVRLLLHGQRAGGLRASWRDMLGAAWLVAPHRALAWAVARVTASRASQTAPTSAARHPSRGRQPPPSVCPARHGTMTRHGTRHSTARHDMAPRPNTARHATMGHGTPRHGGARHGTPRWGTTTRHARARHGTMWHGTARHSTIRHSMTRRTTLHTTARHGTTGQGGMPLRVASARKPTVPAVASGFGHAFREQSRGPSPRPFGGG